MVHSEYNAEPSYSSTAAFYVCVWLTGKLGAIHMHWYKFVWRLLGRQNSMKPRADSHIRVWNCSDILGTNTVPIVRVLLFNTRWSMLLLVCIFTLQRVYLLSVWTQDGMQAIAAGGLCWLFIEPGPFGWLVFEDVWHVCVMNIYRNCNIKGKQI